MLIKGLLFQSVWGVNTPPSKAKTLIYFTGRREGFLEGKINCLHCAALTSLHALSRGGCSAFTAVVVGSQRQAFHPTNTSTMDEFVGLSVINFLRDQDQLCLRSTVHHPWTLIHGNNCWMKKNATLLYNTSTSRIVTQCSYQRQVIYGKQVKGIRSPNTHITHSGRTLSD